jgi:hypothetical protein
MLPNVKRDVPRTGKRSRLKFAAWAILPLMTSCAQSGNEIKASDCSWTKPISISRNDVLTPGTAGQLLAHNRSWFRFCSGERV